jgi:taurine dioxygenase
MAGIEVRNLQDDLSFGSRVKGVNWETLADEGVRQQLRDLFVERGMIVFEDMEPSAKMQVAVSRCSARSRTTRPSRPPATRKPATRPRA